LAKKDKEVRSVPIHLRITPSLHDALVKRAERERRSLSGMIVFLLEETFEDAEKSKPKRR
jgi:hypothetical protein